MYTKLAQSSYWDRTQEFLNIAKRLKKLLSSANNVTPLRNNKCTIIQEFFFFFFFYFFFFFLIRDKIFIRPEIELQQGTKSNPITNGPSVSDFSQQEETHLSTPG